MRDKKELGQFLLALGIIGMVLTAVFVFTSPINTVDGAGSVGIGIIIGPICLILAIVGLLFMIAAKR